MAETPPVTTRNLDEPLHHSLILPVAPELVPLIRTGGKSTTYRYAGGSDKYGYLQLGFAVTITNSANGESVAAATIQANTLTTFGELPVDLPDHHETYQSRDHQRAVFSSYYAYLGRLIADADPFRIITFATQRLYGVSE